MTSKQRSQYTALSVVEGFCFQARESLPIEQKTKKSIKRIMEQIFKMKEALGQPTITDGRHILKKHDKVKDVVSGCGSEIFMMEYINAVQFMLNIMQDNIPSRDVRHEWGKLEGMMFTLYTHMEEIDEVGRDSNHRDIGTKLSWAVMS